MNVRFVSRWLCSLALLCCLAPLAPAADDGFEPIFNGKDLTGWDGNPDLWRVEDGAITGETTKEKPANGNTFCIWRGGDVGDFELVLQYKIRNHNSGIQYRSFEVPGNKWVIGGYQADFEGGDGYSGILYGERERGILAQRGQQVEIGEDHKPKVTKQLGDAAELQKKIKKEDWNEYRVIAQGNHLIHKINGETMVDVTDNDKEATEAGKPGKRLKGILAFQLHAGPPMKVQFKDIKIKRSGSTAAPASEKPAEEKKTEEKKPEEKKAATITVPSKSTEVAAEEKKTDSAKPAPSGAESSAKKKKILFIAGNPSHGFGAHDHKAGCTLLANRLNASGLPIEATVQFPGWPKDAKAIEGYDAIVVYADGGGGHPIAKHVDEVIPLAKKGMGLGFIHYGVEVEAGKVGDAFLDWTGGYFEKNWSVNPHWTLQDVKLNTEHPICRGAKPYAVNDEWYYHMRFRPKMQGVEPILTAMPPKDTVKGDGSHSGNPAVREAVANGEPQHLMWATQRADGGRGFGFTGGHDHWNWGHNDHRKLVLNACVWITGLDVPSGGVPEKGPVTVDELLENHDEQPPANFNKETIEKKLAEFAKPYEAKK